MERRAFLRRLTGEAVSTTARLAGLSSVVRRSLVAAGEAATRDLDPAGRLFSGPAAPAPTASPATTPAGEPPPPSQPTPWPAATAALTPRQEAFLDAGTTAVLGLNDPTGGPHLTSSIYHWDGAAVRVPSELLGARAVRIDADPRVSVLIRDASSDAWVAMVGLASIVSGDDVQSAMLVILRKYMADAEADRQWTERRSNGDQVVIVIHPTRYVWRLD
ncbi:MAG: pyridoxamine 5'-phosphate oxidase family protein [Chloroflexota bacterium]